MTEDTDMDELKVAIFQGEDLVAEGASMADALQWLLVGRVDVPRKHDKECAGGNQDDGGDYRCCSTHCVYGKRGGVEL